MNSFPAQWNVQRWGEENFKHSLKTADGQASQKGGATGAIFTNLLTFENLSLNLFEPPVTHVLNGGRPTSLPLWSEGSYFGRLYLIVMSYNNPSHLQTDLQLTKYLLKRIISQTHKISEVSLTDDHSQWFAHSLPHTPWQGKLRRYNGSP